MVDAHMDELGGMIRRVTPRGLLTMQMLGGWLDQALVDQRWIILGSKGPVRRRDRHPRRPRRARRRAHARLFARQPVSRRRRDHRSRGRGDGHLARRSGRARRAVHGAERHRQLPREGLGRPRRLRRASSRRCARLATLPHPKQIVWTITTQEEVGLRGAEAAAAVVKPEIAIAIEGGITGDVFPGRAEETQARLGAGPGDLPLDSSALPNRKLTQLVKQTAATACRLATTR